MQHIVTGLQHHENDRGHWYKAEFDTVEKFGGIPRCSTLAISEEAYLRMRVGMVITLTAEIVPQSERELTEAQ